MAVVVLRGALAFMLRRALALALALAFSISRTFFRTLLRALVLGAHRAALFISGGDCGFGAAAIDERQ